jgi:hypothetical protein
MKLNTHMHVWVDESQIKPSEVSHWNELAQLNPSVNGETNLNKVFLIKILH